MGLIILFVLLGLVGIAAMVLFIYYGVKLCKAGNGWGVVLFFLGLGFIGLIIGIVLLNKAKDDQDEINGKNETSEKSTETESV